MHTFFCTMYCQTVFSSVYIKWQSHQQRMKVPVTPHPCQIWRYVLFHLCVFFKLQKISRTEPRGLCDKQWNIIKFMATVIIPQILVCANDSEWYYIELQTLLNCWSNQSHCLQWKILQKWVFLTFWAVAFSGQQRWTTCLCKRAKLEQIKIFTGCSLWISK